MMEPTIWPRMMKEKRQKASREALWPHFKAKTKTKEFYARIKKKI